MVIAEYVIPLQDNFFPTFSSDSFCFVVNFFSSLFVTLIYPGRLEMVGPGMVGMTT